MSAGTRDPAPSTGARQRLELPSDSSATVLDGAGDGCTGVNGTLDITRQFLWTLSSRARASTRLEVQWSQMRSRSCRSQAHEVAWEQLVAERGTSLVSASTTPSPTSRPLSTRPCRRTPCTSSRRSEHRRERLAHQLAGRGSKLFGNLPATSPVTSSRPVTTALLRSRDHASPHLAQGVGARSRRTAARSGRAPGCRRRRCRESTQASPLSPYDPRCAGVAQLVEQLPCKQ